MTQTQDELNRMIELNNRVAELEDKVQYLLTHLQIQYIAPAGPAISPQMQQVIDLLRKNNLIEAIKVYRQATGVGLAEAKLAVEEIARQAGTGFNSQANNHRA